MSAVTVTFSLSLPISASRPSMQHPCPSAGLSSPLVCLQKPVDQDDLGNQLSALQIDEKKTDSFVTPLKSNSRSTNELCAVCLSPLLVRRTIDFDDEDGKDVAITSCKVSFSI
jgi:hypothetical protein